MVTHAQLPDPSPYPAPTPIPTPAPTQVTNAQFPDQMDALVPVTQLYI